MTETTVTQGRIDNIIARAELQDMKMGAKTTVVQAVLPNGFTITETSSCVDPENYDHEVGKNIAINRIKGRLWELEGYLLQSKLNGENNT